MNQTVNGFTLTSKNGKTRTLEPYLVVLLCPTFLGVAHKWTNSAPTGPPLQPKTARSVPPRALDTEPGLSAGLTKGVARFATSSAAAACSLRRRGATREGRGFGGGGWGVPRRGTVGKSRRFLAPSRKQQKNRAADEWCVWVCAFVRGTLTTRPFFPPPPEKNTKLKQHMWLVCMCVCLCLGGSLKKKTCGW